MAEAGKRLLLIGTSEGRPFILEESLKITQALGVELVLLDNPEARALSRATVPDAGFIGAPIDSHDPVAVAGIVEKVARATGGSVDAVITFLNPYAELAGMLVDVLGAAGNTGAAVTAAHTKSTAREVLSRIPEVAAAYRVVASDEEAVKAYGELGGGKFVMKPIHGGGSALVITDIDSPEKAAAVFREIEEGIRDFALRPDAGVFLLDQNPGILMERQFEGPEVDVELVLEEGKIKFWHVSDSPTDMPYAFEKGMTYPSQLPPAWQRSLVEVAGLAVSALGLKTGNMHVEMMATADGPRIIEINARMGGAFVWQVIQDVTGINLIEQGVRSTLGLCVSDGGAEPAIVIVARFIVPSATGTIEVLEGLDALGREPGIQRVTVLKQTGDAVQALPDDWLGWVTATARTYLEAETAMLDALAKVRISIRQADGKLVEQTGAHAHQKVDITALLAPAVRLGPPERRVG